MKLGKKLVAVLLLVVLVASLAACSSNSIVGVWKMDLDSYLKAMCNNQQEYETAKAEMEYANIEMIWEFTANGKLIRKQSYDGQFYTEETTYKTDGNKVNIDNVNTDITYKVDGKKLTLTAEGITVTFYRK